jgi:prepilin-type N-terminal cleavage/methylation domain-containing protein
MRILAIKRVHSGFSLIEVMIAVVVLATGLLALAALQAKLTTNSADAKARSRIAALMTSVIDFERAQGYGSIAEGGTTFTCDTTAAAPSIPNLICVAESDAGVSGVSLSQSVTRYYGDPSSSSFSTTAPGAGVSIYGDYKEIALTATWTDATGSTRTLASNTITSNLDLNANASTVLSQNLTASASMNPVVHETNPGNTAGVIPIAIGSGTGEYAASTNPKPTVSSSGANSTTFNTLNYASDANSSTATIQKRIETEVAECVCRGASSNPFGSDTLFGQDRFRPSYWGGTRYVAPAVAAGTPSSAAATSVTQSAECDICCRDHDDTGIATTEVRYDAVTGDTKRYKVKLSGSNIVTPIELETDSTTGEPVAADISSDAYLDACRFIRVDGLWRVATDIQATHVGLIATNDEQGVATNKAAPYDANQTLYEAFVVNAVKAYLASALPTNGSPEWSNFLTNTLATIFSTSAPDVPTTNPVIANTSGTYRYLHAHGLYIDHLETDAINKLNAIVSSSCKTTDSTYPKCLLAYLPFSTINISGLANWLDTNDTSDAAGTVPLNKTVLQLGAGTSTSTTCGNGTSFGGCVKGLTTGYADAKAKIGHSNSGIAASIAVSPYERDDTKVLSASQKFQVGSTTTSDLIYANVTGPDVTPTGFNFVQNFSTASLNSNINPTVAWSTNSLSDFCSPNAAKKATTPNLYSCNSTVAYATPTVITVGGGTPSTSYNQLGKAVVYSSNPCPGATGNAKHVGVTVKGLVCYKLSTTTLTDTSSTRIDCNTTTNPTSCYNIGTFSVQNSGTSSESTAVTISSVTGTPAALTNATLNMTFIYSASKVGTYTCDANNLPVAVDPTSCN